MRQLLMLLICAVLIAFQSDAQNSRIYGVVKSYYTNFIIPNASMYLLKNGRIVQKTISDDSGDFTFTDVEAGEYSISAYDDSTNYSALEHVVLGSNSLLFVSVEMGNAPMLKEIVVVEKRRPVTHEIIKQDQKRYRSGCEIIALELASVAEKKKSGTKD